MGVANELQLHREDAHRVAIELAEETGLLARCDCGELYDPLTNAHKETYALAYTLLKKRDPRVTAFADDPRVLTDAIRDVCRPFPATCGCKTKRRD